MQHVQHTLAPGVWLRYFLNKGETTNLLNNSDFFLTFERVEWGGSQWSERRGNVGSKFLGAA